LVKSLLVEWWKEIRARCERDDGGIENEELVRVTMGNLFEKFCFDERQIFGAIAGGICRWVF
jgi:hypothetical protein